MQKKIRLRLIRKLLTLTVLVGMLGFLTAGRPAAAGPDCGLQYELCGIRCPPGGPLEYDCPAEGCWAQFMTCLLQGN